MEARKSYPEEISQDVDIYLIKDINEENRLEEIEKIWRVVQYYQGTGLKNLGLFIIYYDEELLKKEDGMPDKKKRKEYHSEYFRYLFQARDVNEIKNIDDVEKHLKKSRSAS